MEEDAVHHEFLQSSSTQRIEEQIAIVNKLTHKHAALNDLARCWTIGMLMFNPCFVCGDRQRNRPFARALSAMRPREEALRSTPELSELVTVGWG
eukprot:5852366-Amphidinium_carterae.1